MTALEFRDLSGMAEFETAVTLQQAVWGQDDRPDPADLMMVVQKEGGLVGGAFRDGRLLGYVFGFPTRDPGVQHSHRLAVLPEARGLGLGRRLKLYQRDWCLARGIARVRWTYDPLRLANASLNIARLGAGAETYYVDFYGEMAGINAGVASDRLLADWSLDDPRVAALARGEMPAAPKERHRLTIPEDFGALLRDDPARAAAERLAARQALQAAFAEGLRVTGFDIAARSYLLGEG